MVTFNKHCVRTIVAVVALLYLVSNTNDKHWFKYHNSNQWNLLIIQLNH